MAETIRQKVKFDLPPGKLFRFYMDPKLHAELIGAKTRVSSEPGSVFSAYGGDLRGKMLHVVRNKIIVQTWRGSDWDKKEMDSILTLVFNERDKGTELEMVHTNVPERFAADIREGWNEYYWKPWKIHIKKAK
ncbi:MAG TPA: SRPBCC domain-containing protein [Spirochaetia bacterium]|nr:SRPBCC domain-containing protein [Spirochaetia bacterium]